MRQMVIAVMLKLGKNCKQILQVSLRNTFHLLKPVLSEELSA